MPTRLLSMNHRLFVKGEDGNFYELLCPIEAIDTVDIYTGDDIKTITFDYTDVTIILRIRSGSNKRRFKGCRPFRMRTYRRCRWNEIYR